LNYQLIIGPDIRLNQQCREVTFDDDITELKKALKEICDQYKGVGLAANQIGSDLRVFYLNMTGPRWYVNPEILSASAKSTFLGEGCLSFPDEMFATKRHHVISIRHDGGPDENLTGLEAIAFLHELDHLNGITMHERKI